MTTTTMTKIGASVIDVLLKQKNGAAIAFIGWGTLAAICFLVRNSYKFNIEVSLKGVKVSGEPISPSSATLTDCNSLLNVAG